MEKNNGRNYIKLSTRKHFLFLKVMVITHYQLPQESLDSRAHTSFCRPTKAKVDRIDPKHFHTDLDCIVSIHNLLHIDLSISAQQQH